MSNERIGVLAGGDSPEREISLTSGVQVDKALHELGYGSVLLAIDTADDIVPALEGIDVAFNVLHGGAGEDGTITLLLDVLEIPYTGSGALACYRAMDKARTRALLASRRIPVPKGLSYPGRDVDAFLADVERALAFPMVVKPTNLGSTIGVTVVHDFNDLTFAALSTLKQYASLLVEEFASGRELTAAILDIDGRATSLPIVEVTYPELVFDFHAKETKEQCAFYCPADIPPALVQRVNEISLKAHHVLGCSGFSRVDLRLGHDETPLVIELNTIPGMTPTSDFPRAARAARMDMPLLVKTMLATAFNRCDTVGGGR